MAWNNRRGARGRNADRMRQDEEDEALLLMSASLMLMHPSLAHVDNNQPLPQHDGSFTDRQWVERVLYGHHRRSIDNMRITTDNFLLLSNILVERQYVPHNYQQRVPIQEALAMTLMLVSHKHTHRVLGTIFDRSIETINRNIKKVLRGLCLFAAEIIRPGDQTAVHPRIANSTNFYPWFKDAVGAMDGTHISACPPTGEQMAYTNRHGWQSQNVLAVCDHDMRFIYVYAGWEGSAHDARVLESALAYPSDFPLPQPGQYYLVDAAYRNAPGFMPPYKNVGSESPSKTLFNTRHSQLRNVIERTFGVLKKRFKWLKGPVDNFYMSTQISIVIACCALHNFLRMHQPEDAHFQRFESQDVHLNEEPEIGGLVPQSFALNVSPAELAEWKAKRDYIATQMYAARGRRRR
ncbi:putative nuclease HARBI1 [Coffea eugenioides]|uniref:putative nuclease HARBI1 n=1 Tax=Coffea eugenioides TaxID=49369 RepID=UPI000F606698|nr:putative nuclease HARBI1 [Coffea eugenioides]